MTLRPPGIKKPKDQVQFRGDVENVEWAEKFVGKGGKNPSLSEIVNWLFGLGRQNYEALHEFEGRFEEIKRLEDVGDVEAIRLVVRLGLAAYSKDGKARK